jgi:hypothetical protein
MVGTSGRSPGIALLSVLLLRLSTGGMQSFKAGQCFVQINPVDLDARQQFPVYP